MNFICEKDKGHKFSVQKPANLPTEVINGREIESPWKWKGIVHCPYCGTDDIIEDLGFLVGVSEKPNLEAQRRANRQITIESQQMAAKALREQNERDPEIAFAPDTAADKRYGGGVKVRKSILDKINEKKPEGYS